jgi:hypothetical protein
MCFCIFLYIVVLFNLGHATATETIAEVVNLEETPQGGYFGILGTCVTGIIGIVTILGTYHLRYQELALFATHIEFLGGAITAVMAVSTAPFGAITFLIPAAFNAAILY